MTQRKRMEVKAATDLIQEHEGLKIGQEIYCYRHPDRVPSHGSVTSIHVTPGEDSYVTFYCDATGQFRRALVREVFIEPDDKLRRAVNKIISKAKGSDKG